MKENQIISSTAAGSGHEAALFLPTATMANQIALRVLGRPGGELIAEERSKSRPRRGRVKSRLFTK